VSCEVDSFIAGDPTHYVANITSASVPPYEYFWTFGDGTFGYGDDIYHIYDDGGNYTVSLTVVDSNGCEAYCQTQIDVSSYFDVDFNINGLPLDSLSGCAPLTIDFDNVSVNATSQFWDFGDGQYSTDQSPTHTFDTPGLYTVSLHGYSSTGSDSASVENLINVLPAPVASFIPVIINYDSGEDTVQFVDNSLGAVAWSWDFGDPGSGANNFSTISNPLHVYSTNGTFSASLVVSNQFGCMDSISIPHSVNVGVQDFKLIQEIYPNPTAGSVVVNTNMPAALLNISVTDNLGRVLNTPIVKNGSNSERIELDLSGFENGTYLLRVFDGESESTLPLILIKDQ
jgi:PKD repeat protein